MILALEPLRTDRYRMLASPVLPVAGQETQSVFSQGFGAKVEVCFSITGKLLPCDPLDVRRGMLFHSVAAGAAGKERQITFFKLRSCQVWLAIHMVESFTPQVNCYSPSNFPSSTEWLALTSQAAWVAINTLPTSPSETSQVPSCIDRLKAHWRGCCRLQRNKPLVTRYLLEATIR